MMGELVQAGSLQDRAAARAVENLERRLVVESCGGGVFSLPASGTSTPIVLEDVDRVAPWGWFELVGGFTVFVCPFVGWWTVECHFNAARTGTGAGSVAMRLSVNDGGWSGGVRFDTSGASTVDDKTMTVPMFLGEGDRVRLRLGHSVSAGVSSVSGSVLFSWRGNPQGLRIA